MFGEVFLCDFPYTSGAISKRRPVLVLFDLNQDALVCRITSVIRSGPLDVLLVDWKVAELALERGPAMRCDMVFANGDGRVLAVRGNPRFV